MSMPDGIRQVLQSDLEAYLHFERVALPLRQSLIDAALSGAIEQGRLTIDANAVIEPLIIENMADPNVAAHIMMDSFRAVHLAVAKGCYEEAGGIAPELLEKLRAIRQQTVMVQCTRLRSAARAAWDHRKTIAIANQDWTVGGRLVMDRVRLVELHGAVILLRMALKHQRQAFAHLCLNRIQVEYSALLRA